MKWIRYLNILVLTLLSTQSYGQFIVNFDQLIQPPQETIDTYNDQRVSILMRNWNLVFTNPKFVDDARESLRVAVPIANRALVQAVCNIDSNCFRQMGCQVRAPFLPICPAHFQFLAGTGSNVYLAQVPRLHGELPTQNNLLHSFKSPRPIFEIAPEIIYAHGTHLMNAPITHYAVVSELLAQYWASDEATRLRIFKNYAADYPNEDRRPELMKFIRWKAREWVETNIVDRALLPAELKAARHPLVPLKSARESLAELTASSISTEAEDIIDSLDSPNTSADFLIKGDDLVYRYRKVYLELQGTKGRMPVVLGCGDRRLTDLVYEAPACSETSVTAETTDLRNAASTPYLMALEEQRKFLDDNFINWSDSKHSVEQLKHLVTVASFAVTAVTVLKWGLLVPRALTLLKSTQLAAKMSSSVLAKNASKMALGLSGYLVKNKKMAVIARTGKWVGSAGLSVWLASKTAELTTRFMRAIVTDEEQAKLDREEALVTVMNHTLAVVTAGDRGSDDVESSLNTASGELRRALNAYLQEVGRGASRKIDLMNAAPFITQ